MAKILFTFLGFGIGFYMISTQGIIRNFNDGNNIWGTVFVLTMIFGLYQFLQFIRDDVIKSKDN